MRWEAIDTSGSPRRQPLPTCSQSSHEVRQRHSVRWCRWCDGRPSLHHAPLCLLATDYRSVPTIQYNTITSDVHSESEAQAVTRGEDAKAGLTEHTHIYIPLWQPFVRDYPVELVPDRKNQSVFYWNKRQWVAVASAGPYASLHLAPDR